MHPDFDKIRDSDDFHEWAEEQPKWVQDALYENQDDARSAARAIDLYKSDRNIKAQKGYSDKDAARYVDSKSSRSKPAASESGKMLKESIRVTGKSVVKTTANYLYDSLKHVMEHPNYKQWWRRGARESFESLERLNKLVSPMTIRQKQRFFGM